MKVQWGVPAVTGGAVAGMAGFGEREEPCPAPPLAMGSVRGARMFWAPGFPVIFRDGVPYFQREDPGLFGAYGGTWHPGANEADCRRSRAVGEEDPVPWHEPASLPECGCGFWAYWDGLGALEYWARAFARHHMAEYPPFPLLGIIEGWGRTRTGGKGFRCAKARILALAPAFSPRITGAGVRYSAVSVPELELQGELIPGAGEREAAFPRLSLLRQLYDAWLAGFETWLGNAYPEARIFTTPRAMLASVKTGRITP